MKPIEKLVKSYYSHQDGEVYFNLVKISNAAQYNAWALFSQEAPVSYSTDGILTFRQCLSFYDNQDTEVWVAYASNEAITNPDDIFKGNIEMYMSVTTSVNAPFIVHLGIQRVDCDTQHKNISMKLHKFSAQTMQDLYSNKLFMLSAPTEAAREIMLNTIKQDGKGEAIYLFDYNDAHPDKDLEKYIQYLKSQVKSLGEQGKKPNIKLLSMLHLKEDIAAQRKKIAEGKLFPNLTTTDDGDQFTIRDKHIGQELFTASRSDDEFNYFFDNYDLFQLGCRGSCSNIIMVSVELAELATLFD